MKRHCDYISPDSDDGKDGTPEKTDVDVVDRIKCSNCSRGPQPVSEFVNDMGKQMKTCRKCRDKGKRLDQKRVENPDGARSMYKKQYAKVNRPDIKWREKQRQEDEAAYLAHNAKVHREWHAKNRDHVAEWGRNNLNRRWANICTGAKERGLVLELTIEQYEVLAVQPCFYCGEVDPQFPYFGLDRMDNSVGYTLANVVPCCEPCNTMKSCLDPTTFIDRVEDVMFAQDNKQESTTHTESWCNSKSKPDWNRYKTRMLMKTTMVHTLTEHHFGRLIQQPCYFCLTTTRYRGIDRLNNDLGYTLENVVPACSACNYLKNDVPMDIFLRKCRQIISRMEVLKSKIPSSIPRNVLSIQKRDE